VARAIKTEINEGRGFDGGYVNLELMHLGAEKIKERLPGIRQIAIDFANIDPILKPLPVQPGQHYSMGALPQTRTVKLRYLVSMPAGNVPALVYMGRTGLAEIPFLKRLFSGRSQEKMRKYIHIQMCSWEGNDRKSSS